MRFLTLCFALYVFGANAQTYSSVDVINIYDGDTIVVKLKNNNRMKVRLSDIDAPEKSSGRSRPGQPFSNYAETKLRELIHKQKVDLTCYEIDKYERAVCQVYKEGLDINAEMVIIGAAWVSSYNKVFVRNLKNIDHEIEAKNNKIGLWSGLEKPIPPWIWRKKCWNVNYQIDFCKKTG